MYMINSKLSYSGEQVVLLLVQVVLVRASLNRAVLLKMPSDETPKMSISPSHKQIEI